MTVRDFAIEGYLFTIVVDKDNDQALVIGKKLGPNGENRSLVPFCQAFDLSE